MQLTLVALGIVLVASLLAAPVAAAPGNEQSSPKLPAGVTAYEVAPGDTLLGIAQSFGITSETILWANGMPSGDLLQIGQKLTILPVSGVLHKVKPGESILGIAATYKADPAGIVEANGLSDSNMVREGDVLLVPGGVMELAPAAEPPQDRDPSTRGGQRDARSFVANVTAYAMKGRTATGTQTRWGVIAVDPAMIPLGSKVRIDGFEELFVAEDTGGGIKGNWIDLWFPSQAEAMRFGIQARRVTVVGP